VRFSPHDKLSKIHRFQYIYAWFFYGLMTISWVTKKEFLQLKEYKNQGLTKSYGLYAKLFIELIVWKLLYFAYMIVIPILILPFSP